MGLTDILTGTGKVSYERRLPIRASDWRDGLIQTQRFDSLEPRLFTWEHVCSQGFLDVLRLAHEQVRGAFSFTPPGEPAVQVAWADDSIRPVPISSGFYRVSVRLQELIATD